MATGAGGALATPGALMPVHQMTDTGFPWLMTTQSPFTTPSPAPHTPPSLHPFTLNTSRSQLKRDGLLNKHSELVLSDVLGVGFQVLDFTMSYLPTSVPYVPFSPAQPTMTTDVGDVPSPNSAIMASVDVTNDPIAKAVMENVLGRLPTKKPRVTVKCDVCNLEFSSQTVLDSHLAGSKHQRKVKSADLMKTLEETETGFERDEVSGVIRCIICDVTVNSPQLLATHIAGNKHKQRAAKRAGDPNGGPPAKRPCFGGGVTGQNNMNSNGDGQDIGPPGDCDSNIGGGGGAASSNLDIPDCVTKLEETKGGGKYLCNPCQAHCNSEQQLAQHLSSMKHLGKQKGGDAGHGDRVGY